MALTKLRIGYLPYSQDYEKPRDKRRFVHYAKKRNLNFISIVEIRHQVFMQNITKQDVYLSSLFRTNKKLYVILDMENTYLQNFHQ